jgi:asparagine synthase (glutamine-hydrolysing)
VADHGPAVTELTPLQIATGIVFGTSRGAPPLPRGGSPALAIHAALLPALRRGPCFVSFSGGRDSSAVLAAATHAARREGLGDPVPLTIQSAGAPRSHETDWQERVVSHLGLGDWIRIEVADELDAVGPYARRVLERHGLLWPFNVHFHLPMLEQVAGGTLFTGAGGDELWAASHVRRERPRRRLLGLAPHAIQARVLGRNRPIGYPWLRPEAVRDAKRIAGAHTASEPWRLARRMRWYRSQNAMATGLRGLALIAADAGATIEHPLLDSRLWGAVLAAAPRGGFRDRESALATVAGHLLPPETVSRRTKASFDAIFFHEHARAFVREWAGEGVSEAVVDRERLRVHWQEESPDAHSYTLLQAAWLATRGATLDVRRVVPSVVRG